MSILNRPSDGLFNVLICLFKQVLMNGAVKRERLIDLCAPPTLCNQEKAHQTLNTWVELGLFRQDAQTQEIDLAIDRPNSKAQRESLLRKLPSITRGFLLKAENNTRFWEQTDNRGSDFIRAIAWALCQSPYEFQENYEAAEASAAAQLGEAGMIFTNDTRWKGFASWAVFTGFASSYRHQPGFGIDPTPAVREALTECAASKEDIAIESLVERLARALPVLDGGEYRRQLEGRLIEGTWRRPGPHQISQSLSLALTRLQEAGTLRLDARADAPQRELLGRGNRKLRGVSHVVYLAEN